MTLTNFPNGISSFGIPVLGGAAGIPFTGSYFFVDPVIGADGNEGSPSLPLATLSGALNRCTSGNNDVIILVGDGTTAATARESATLAWNKDATHLIGVTAPTGFAQRARISPATSATVFSPFVQVTGDGCLFANVSTFYGFADNSAQVCWLDQGERNYYYNVQFGGMGAQLAADHVGGRSLVIGAAGTGRGEHTFERCVIGLDTVTRGAANSSLELLGATPRNVFRNCIFPLMADADAPLIFLGAAAGAIDRFAMFDQCQFINAIGSTSTQQTNLGDLAASSGGLLLFNGCTLVGFTEFGDAGTLAQTYVNMAAPSASAGGIAVNPS